MKRFFKNPFVRTVILTILGLIATKMYYMADKALSKITTVNEVRIADSSNIKNVQGQFWDLFEDMTNNNKRLQGEIDSIKRSCCKK